MTDAGVTSTAKSGAPGLTDVIDDTTTIEIECPVNVKTETEQPRDCLICSCRTDDQWFDVFWTETRSGHTPLVTYVCRVADVRLAGATEDGGAVACGTCVELINVLERAELEYLRLKDSFLTIISENGAFENIPSQDVKHIDVEVNVKSEAVDEQAASRSRTKSARTRGRDSDDEPLALRKKSGKKSGKRRKESKEQLDYPNEEFSVSADVVKEEEEILCTRRRQRFPKILFDAESNVTAVITQEDYDWADDSHEPDDDYAPSEEKVKSKRKRHSLQNGVRKRSRQKSNTEDVLIPVQDETSTLGADTIDNILKTALEKAERSVKSHRRKKDPKLPKVHYPCNECTSTFSSVQRLALHQTKHQAGKAPFICEICGVHYKHKKACDIHVALHKGISDWKCEECNRLFPSKGALQRHNNIHTGKPNYQCDLCGKSFIHTSSFKMHKLSHSGLKPHSCDVCGLALMTRSHLNRHKRIHSGEKRHECTVCGKRFSERYNLLAHQKAHDQPPTQGQPAKRPPWQGFRCHLCDKRFERRYMLEKHLETVHQRILEKGPPRPRNTMTKLLKAQAASVSKSSARTDSKEQTTCHDQDSASVVARPVSSTPEDNSVEEKPHVDSQNADDKDTGNTSKSSPQPPATSARASLATGEAYETLRLVNGAWASGSYVATEYTMRIAEYPQ